MIDDDNDAYQKLSQQNAQLKTDLETREYQLDVISRVVRDISTSLDIDTVLSQVAEQARKLIDADTLAVPIINEEQNVYAYKAVSGKNAKKILQQSFPVHIGLCGWVLNNQQEIFFGEGSEQLMDKEVSWEPNMDSLLLVPLKYRDKIIGGLSGTGKKGGGSFTQRDLEMLTLFAGQVSIAIDNSIIFGELQQERDFLSTVLNSIADAVVTIDNQKNIIRMNPVALKMSGSSSEEVLGRKLSKIFNIVDTESKNHNESPIDEILSKGRDSHKSFERIFISRDGSEYYISCRVSSLKNDNQEIMGAILAFHDITEEYRLLDKIKSSELRHRHLIQSLSDEYFFFRHDVNGVFNYLSPSVSNILGYSVEEFSNHYKTFLTDNPINDKVDEYTEKSLKGLKQPAYELESYTKDGSVRILQIKESPVFDNNGEVIAIEGLAHDVTEYRANEMALRRTQKMEAIGQLSGGIAHDFNNQLGVVIGYLDLLKAEFDKQQRQYQWIEAASRASMRCIDLTAQLLSFSRKQGKDKKLIDINISLENLKTMVTRSLTSEIEVQYRLSSEAETVLVNEGEFNDALLNLVINARDAMSRGGMLVLKTQRIMVDEQNSLIQKGLNPGPYVVLSIIDNGKGMSKEVQDRVFEPFFTTKISSKGTGLGMPMVYGFAQRYNGYIGLDSVPDKGTTFKIYLPYVERETGSDRDAASNGNQVIMEKGNEKILIVDDEIDLLQLADTYLTSLGYTTLLAAGAREAIEILSSNDDIDLLFTDIVMPGTINGYELAEKAHAMYPEMKIILTSGYTSQKPLAENATSFNTQLLRKPYRKDALAKIIRDTLDEVAKDA